ncbi:hypothetical protein RRSWK_03941 [Rhodopirellula sp. SWK7]|nr:hypothetical protein RRSWK_03941 [Rhodopirellula sp. SWK7]
MRSNQSTCYAARPPDPNWQRLDKPDQTFFSIAASDYHSKTREEGQSRRITETHVTKSKKVTRISFEAERAFGSDDGRTPIDEALAKISLNGQRTPLPKPQGTYDVPLRINRH